MQPRGYGTAHNNNSPVAGRNTSPAAPSLPLHFTMSHEPQGGPFRMVVVSAIMCALLADTDQRLLNGVIFENVSGLTLLFLSGARAVLLDLIWSMVIATLTAFVFPLNIIAFLIGVDWIIPGRMVSSLLEHGQETVSVLFYLITLFVACCRGLFRRVTTGGSGLRGRRRSRILAGGVAILPPTYGCWLEDRLICHGDGCRSFDNCCPARTAYNRLGWR